MKTVVAKLKKKGGLYYWVIDCPYCHKRHWIEAGVYADNPVNYLGPREVKCHGNIRTIIIESQCRFCRCTDSKACPGGCHWVEPTLCSRCDDMFKAAKAAGKAVAEFLDDAIYKGLVSHEK